MARVPSQKVDAVFNKYDVLSSPGCSLAVIQKGKTVYQKGYGCANLEYGIAITPSTVFHVASVSKQFTAMSVLLLAEAGKLALDDDVQVYVPELPDFGSKITLRHLMHHTSGLRDQWELLVLAGWRMEDVITTQDVLDLLKYQKELNFEPGSEYLYCNSGYTLLGLITERVSRKPLRQFCRENIFEPLGMNDTHFHDDHTEIVKNRAYSYAPGKKGEFIHAVLSYATVGATSLFTTVEDLARWDSNFYDCKVGSKNTLDLMQTPGVLNNGDKISYAFGLSVTTYRGLQVVEHSGGDAGFRSHLLRFPEKHFSVAILSNLSSANPGALARQVADIYLEDDFLLNGDGSYEISQAGSSNILKSGLERLVGIYYNKRRNESQRLELRGENLFLAGGKGFEILPISRDRLRLVEYPEYEIRITGKNDGAVDSIEIMAAPSPPVPYFRTVSRSLAKSEQEDYWGDYYSPELDVTYSIENRDGVLGIYRRKYGFLPLSPTISDGFAGGSMDVLFHRALDNSIVGFTVSTGRVRNLLFKRVNAGKQPRNRKKSKTVSTRKKEVSD